MPSTHNMSELGVFFKATHITAQIGCLPGWGHTASEKEQSAHWSLFSLSPPQFSNSDSGPVTDELGKELSSAPVWAQPLPWNVTPDRCQSYSRRFYE